MLMHTPVAKKQALNRKMHLYIGILQIKSLQQSEPSREGSNRNRIMNPTRHKVIPPKKAIGTISAEGTFSIDCSIIFLPSFPENPVMLRQKQSYIKLSKYFLQEYLQVMKAIFSSKLMD
ncbi:hypothetical protein FGO68_gene8818 [Halteria grandinella]|uniref:Uncharacterized protein n=1 Tax=Halteria grandinella TaxID=5974 RepID=A0A8J8N9I9_HALGN|nr:hypothetical protein FGO68_gene8818 [Halteria grandinella]